jgi:hypothetical protein
MNHSIYSTPHSTVDNSSDVSEVDGMITNLEQENVKLQHC